ncbi:hypothetical protein ACVWZQ_002479 [Thermostichus sp. MS-CIW-29]
MEEVEVSTCEMLATVSLRNLGALAGNPIPQTWQSWPLLWHCSAQHITAIYPKICISCVYISHTYMLKYRYI